jgi:Flp pilus assembly pilin Flp
VKENGAMLVKAYISDESGAVTVDWVVLTAAIVALGMLVLTTLAGPTTNVGDKVAAKLLTITPGN